MNHPMKIWTAFAALFALAAAAVAAPADGPATPKPTLAERREQAALATRERRWDDALRLWRAMDEERPGDPDVSAELGWALLETGDTADARRRFLRATHLDTMNVRARSGLVAIALRAHKTDEAVRLAEETARAKPDSAEAFRALADAQRAAAHRAEAETAYRRAVALDPADAAAQAGLGATLTTRGKLDEAVKAYRAAVRLEPGNADYQEGLGRAALQAGLSGEAALAFATAMDIVRAPAPDWPRLDGLALVTLDALNRASSAVHHADEPRESLFHANTRLLAVSDALLDLPELEDADPTAAPAMAQRALGFGLMGQAAAGDLAALRKGSASDAADAFVLRDQARRAFMAARAATTASLQDRRPGGLP